jgi:Spy/CpxP family protein refolding chaperone
MTTLKKSILAVSAALALGLIATPILLARGGERSGHRALFGGHFGHHGGAFVKVLHELDLTDEQKTALHAIHKDARERNAAAKAALHDGLMDAARVLVTNPDNIAGAQAAIAGRQAAIEELKQGTLTAVSQALAVLTPEQRAKVAAHLAEHRKEHSR